MAQRAPRSFRIVAESRHIPVVEQLLRAEGFGFEPEPFHPLCRRLTEEPVGLGRSLVGIFGKVYIQDRSSMLPPVALDPPAGARVLDMCASPGSKTGMLAQMVGREGLVMGVEPQRNRMATLRANLRRMNLYKAVAATGAAERLPFATESWDYILLDPPCSGWGTVDRNPSATTVWTGSRLDPLLRLQRKLLKKAAEMLRPGGRLVYSTCTTNVDENEAQTRWAMDELGLELVPLGDLPGFAFEQPEQGLSGVWRVSPSEDGQGFYVCALTKPGTPGPLPEAQARRRLPGVELDMDDLDCPEAADFSLLPPGEIWEFKGGAVFLPQETFDIAPEKLRWAGMVLGRVADGVFRPNAGCSCLIPETGGAGVLDLEEYDPLARLKQGQQLPAPAGEGQVALRWRGLPLGWLGRKGERVLWATR